MYAGNDDWVAFFDCGLVHLPEMSQIAQLYLLKFHRQLMSCLLLSSHRVYKFVPCLCSYSYILVFFHRKSVAVNSCVCFKSKTIRYKRKKHVVSKKRKSDSIINSFITTTTTIIITTTINNNKKCLFFIVTEE